MKYAAARPLKKFEKNCTLEVSPNHPPPKSIGQRRQLLKATANQTIPKGPLHEWPTLIGLIDQTF